MSDPCCGPCNHRWRKAQAAYEKARANYDPLDPDTSPPEPPQIRPMEGRPWCLECAWAIRQQLGQLDRLAALRISNDLGADGYPADANPERVSGSQEPPSPSEHADDVHDVARMLADWEWAYRRHMKWPAAERYGSLADQRTECIAWLAERLDGILTSPLAADFGAEVMEWHADLKAKTKAGIRTLRKPLRCPECRLLMLVHTDGDRDVKCCTPGCNFMMALDSYYATVEHVAAGIGNGSNTSEAAQLAPR